MSGRSGRYRVLGALNILVGGVVVVASTLEAIVNSGARPAFAVLAGVSAVAGAVLMVSGPALWAGRPLGRRLALQGAVSLIPIHLMAVLVARPGIPALLLGIAYPAIVVALLVRGGRDGAVATMETREDPSHPDPKGPLRVVSVA